MAMSREVATHGSIGAASATRHRDRGRTPGLVSCAVTLVLVTLSLRVLGFRASYGLARRIGRRYERASDATWDTVVAAARGVSMAAAFYPGRALCLEQSLALFVCLRRVGVPVDLRVGVQPFPFTAHAWIEFQGQPVAENVDTLHGLVRLPLPEE